MRKGKKKSKRAVQDEQSLDNALRTPLPTFFGAQTDQTGTLAPPVGDQRKTSSTLVDDSGLAPVPDVTHNASVRSLVEQRQLVADLRDSVLTARMELRHQRSLWTSRREATVEAQRAYMTAVKHAMSNSSTLQTNWSIVEMLYEDLQASNGAFAPEEKKTRSLVNRLSRLELKYGSEEAILFEQMQRAPGLQTLPSVLRPRADAGVRFQERPEVLDTETKDEEIPPLLAQYYDKTGDLTIARERVLELDAEHNRESLQRDEIIDGLTDLQFEESYRIERRSMMRELHSIEAEVGQLRQLCTEAGLQPEGPDPDLPAVLDPPIMRSEARMPPALSNMTTRPALYDYVYDGLTSALPTYTEVMDTNERINSWLGSVSRSGQSSILISKSLANMNVTHQAQLAPSQEQQQVEFFSNSSVVEVMQFSHTHDQSLAGISHISSRSNMSPPPRKSWNGELPRRRYSDTALAQQQNIATRQRSTTTLSQRPV